MSERSRCCVRIKSFPDRNRFFFNTRRIFFFLYPSSLKIIKKQTHIQTQSQSQSLHNQYKYKQTTGLYGRKYYTEKLSNTQRFEVDVRYKNLKMIGAGAYGLVCKATDTVTGEEVAIKKVRDVFTDLVDAKRILRELKLLMHLGKHANIVHIRDIMINPPNSEDFKDLYIVTNKYDCDLYRILNSGQTLTDDHFSWFLYQLLCGLKYVHSANVMHRDLKPSNLLVNANCDLALCDFGLARGEPGPGVAMTEYVVTRWYRAPELLCENTTYDNMVDMWSVGLIFAEILTKQPLLQGKDYMDQLSRIIKLVGAVSDEDMKCIQVDGAREMVSALSKKYPTPKDFSEFFAPYVCSIRARILQHSFV